MSRLKALRSIAVCVASFSAAANAQVIGVNEARLAALEGAFIRHFGTYVEWPASAFKSKKSPLVVTIVGNATLAEAVRAATKGRKSKGRPFKVVKLEKLPAKREIAKTFAGTHILFLADSCVRRHAEVHKALNKKPVLVVGHAVSFAVNGGIVQFYLKKKKLRFKIANQTASEAGLKIGAQLLRLATIVKRERAPGGK